MEASTTYLVAESSRLKKLSLPTAKPCIAPHHLKISNGSGKLLVNSLSVVCKTSEGSSKTIRFLRFLCGTGKLCREFPKTLEFNATLKLHGYSYNYLHFQCS